MIITFDSIQKDIEAFADDSEEVVLERSTGKVLFTKNGEVIEFKILKNEDSSITNISYQDKNIPYLTFLSRNIAQLDIFAQRIVQKRPGITNFVDGPACVENFLGTEECGKALDLLHKECIDTSIFCSKVIFITADAGHGKTVLLKEYQFRQAKKYLEGSSKFIFWHVDLRGRQLLRLSEALMGDIGDLRISGLWMPSIIRLLQHGFIILSIDGFDELAAEQGSTDALGALALMVNQLQDEGKLVAASRRTFFDTEDYLKRSKLIQGNISSQSIFNQINLNNWSKNEVEEYMIYKDISDPESTYNEILTNLNNEVTHPILTRPYLITRVIDALERYKITPSEFIGGMTDPLDPLKGVKSVIEAFVKREVEQKWIARETGEPYLNMAQHLKILSSVAEEMWYSETDSLSIDLIQDISLLLLDEWLIIDVDRRRQIIEMIKMHALLVYPPDQNSNSRTFEHPEFKDYFTALALGEIFETSLKNDNSNRLGKFLSISQISDSIALYTFSAKYNDTRVIPVLKLLEKLTSKEYKPTYLQTNVGTLIPYILKNYRLDDLVSFSANVTYSSLIFENKIFKNAIIKNGNFLKISFICSHFENFRFINCNFSEASFDVKKSKFVNVIFEDCEFSGLNIYEDGEFIEQIYAPSLINDFLNSLSIKMASASQLLIEQQQPKEQNENIRRFQRLLRLLKRTTFISENNINTKLRSDKNEILDKIIPLMVEHELLEYRRDKGKVWVMTRTQEEILKAESGVGDPMIVSFWKKLESL